MGAGNLRDQWTWKMAVDAGDVDVRPAAVAPRTNASSSPEGDHSGIESCP